MMYLVVIDRFGVDVWRCIARWVRELMAECWADYSSHRPPFHEIIERMKENEFKSIRDGLRRSWRGSSPKWRNGKHPR
jgi:hypothetical protein